MNQEEFELLLKEDTPFLVWFSATWCVPCKKMDKDALQLAARDANVPMYFCDNDYTPGYCNIRRFPTFAYFEKQKMKKALVSSDMLAVCDWIRNLNDVHR
jgi:thiol-disulfide isomerase/thioredoxin